MSPSPPSGYSSTDLCSPPLLSLDARQSHRPRERGSQGYYVTSGSEDGYEEDEDWNVYDDFNNNRPLTNDNQLVSTALGSTGQNCSRSQDARLSRSGMEDALSRNAKRQTLISSHAFGFDAQNTDPHALQQYGFQRPDSLYSDSPRESQLYKPESAGIELITVPALGNEFTNEEVRAMKRPHKRRRKARNKARTARMWVMSDNEYCGCLHPRSAVFFLFGLLAILAVMLYFVIPRVPIIAVQSAHPLVAVPDGASMKTHHKPTNFSMDVKINLRADNTGGWIPTHLRKMEMKVVDISTTKLVGEGVLSDQVLPGQQRTIFQFPVSFSYSSLNATGDETWLHWINACGPKYENTPRPSLSLRFTMTMYIIGLIGKKGTSTQLADLECPFTLQPECVPSCPDRDAEDVADPNLYSQT